MGVQMGTEVIWCSVFQGQLEDVPVYFIEHQGFFGRAGLYDASNHEYADNAARFGFFSRAVLQLCRDLKFKPDIIHCNDWQTALIPAYIKLWQCDKEYFKDTATIFSIHNIGYQGKFPADCYEFLGLGKEHFHADIFECHGKIHFMKGALFFADAICTVSPTYAKEITTSVGSNGLAPYIERRKNDVYGILNGVDYDHWDPVHDPLLPQNYSLSDMSGKKNCKEVLQCMFHLERNPKKPIVAIISRLTFQKGIDLVRQTIESMIQHMGAQFIIIGRGDKQFEDYFGGLPARYGGLVGAFIGYTEMKAHIVEAGADFLLMPSLYEPCGLNQIYSLRYGTIPIVRATGGLCDTVRNYNKHDGCGTGFMFNDPSAGAVYNTVGWALDTYYHRPQHIDKLRHAGMREHFTWIDAALVYEKLYTNALERKKVWVS